KRWKSTEPSERNGVTIAVRTSPSTCVIVLLRPLVVLPRVVDETSRFQHGHVSHASRFPGYPQNRGLGAEGPWGRQRRVRQRPGGRDVICALSGYGSRSFAKPSVVSTLLSQESIAGNAVMSIRASCATCVYAKSAMSATEYRSATRNLR